MDELQKAKSELIACGRRLSEAGLVPATSGNFSTLLTNGNIAITVSGRDKGNLQEQDIMLVDSTGASLDERHPSAETLLHTSLYQRYADAKVILHPHSINSTLISLVNEGDLILEGYELLKAMSGIETHKEKVRVPVFDNDQNIDRLAKIVDKRLSEIEKVTGYLIRGHGFYTWGKSMLDALRHVEALEFLFECELKLREIKK